MAERNSEEHYGVATTWTNKVTVTNEISRHNEGIIIKSNVIGDNKMKGFLLSPSKESNNDPVLDFMADLEMDGNFFSELIETDLPEYLYSNRGVLRHLVPPPLFPFP